MKRVNWLVTTKGMISRVENEMINVNMAGAAALALLIWFPGAGCSKEEINQSVYESMRHISNEKNAGDPNYDPDSIEDYNRYNAIREGELEKQK